MPWTWLGVQGMGSGSAFPLTGGLPSLSSAPLDTGLFRDVWGTMPPSDGLSLCISGVCPETSPCGLLCCQQAAPGSPDSRAVGFCACVGSPTPPGRCSPRPSELHRVAFRAFGPRRPPAVALLRGSLPRLPIPLSTLRRRRYRRLRMPRGQGGWLDLPCGELSSLTHCRFSSALSRTPGLSRCRKRARGTSGRWRQSAPGPL
jgi:hypothetical protein